MGKRENPTISESSAVYMGRPVCFVTEGAEITLWPKGTTKKYRLNLATAYVMAKQGGGGPARIQKGGENEYDD